MYKGKQCLSSFSRKVFAKIAHSKDNERIYLIVLEVKLLQRMKSQQRTNIDQLKYRLGF